MDAVRVRPLDIAELVVEGSEDVAQAFEFGFRLPTTFAGWHRTNLTILIWQLNPHGCLLLYAVAIYVDCFEDSS